MILCWNTSEIGCEGGLGTPYWIGAALMFRLVFALLVVGCGPQEHGDDGFDGANPQAANLDLARLPFATEVIDLQTGPGSGFGLSRLPYIVLGPPQGGGEFNGSSHVLSLGRGGQITLGFSPRACVDGPGADFVVFENPFRVSGDAQETFQELGAVSVSEDGETWFEFACSPGTAGEAQPGCAGWSPVLINGLEESTPLNPETSGGEAFDLEDLGLERIHYLRIRDLSEIGDTPTAGFDLDSVGLVNFQ